MAKKRVKKFDVWVTRNHYASNLIRVSNTATSDVERITGCTIFKRVGRNREFWGELIETALCLKRYGFLPQPATCWNVWIDEKGVMQYREYPILEKYSGRTYKARPIKSEREYYL